LSRDARSLNNALAAGDLRRKRQKELVDRPCGQRLAKDCGPSFMQKQAYPEFIGENLQDRSGSCGARFAGCAHRDVGYIAMIRYDPRGSLVGRHDCGRQALRMKGGLIEIYLAACGKDDIERQRRLAKFPAKLRVKVLAQGR
jgi:hypothetical protein